MIRKTILLVTLVSCFLCKLSNGFAGISHNHFTSRGYQILSSISQSTSSLHAVIDIGSESAFDKTIKNSGESLVVVDYSTTWCGPCKGTLTKSFDFVKLLLCLFSYFKMFLYRTKNSECMGNYIHIYILK
jgi:thiol-disulfide isomerase/thioredoxin